MATSVRNKQRHLKQAPVAAVEQQSVWGVAPTYADTVRCTVTRHGFRLTFGEIIGENTYTAGVTVFVPTTVAVSIRDMLTKLIDENVKTTEKTE